MQHCQYSFIKNSLGFHWTKRLAVHDLVTLLLLLIPQGLLSLSLMNQSMWITRESTGRPMGFWHLKMSSVKVTTLIWTFCVRIPSISYSRRREYLYFKYQNCCWVWTPLLYPPGWDVRKLSESPGSPANGGVEGIHSDWCITFIM